MQFINRRSQYPGRVKLVKVEGSTDLYDLTLAEGEVTGSYEEGTPLDADTLNAMLCEINDTIAESKINSIKITDGKNNGPQTIVGDNKDIVIQLPSIVQLTTASYGSVIIKTVNLSTSYTTVYTAKTYASALVIIAPWSGSAKNTAIFAVSNANGLTSINDVTFVNKSGYTLKQWSGSNFQVAMSSSDANGTYSITIIDAHY